LTAGESHGPALSAILEGIPAGLCISEEAINQDLARRQGGFGRGKRMGLESDRIRILSGVRGGITLGSPISILIENKDHANWKLVMASGREAAVDEKRIVHPRPGHADLGGVIKYRHQDIRNVLERASARETAARVAIGSLCRNLLSALEVSILAWVEQIGAESMPSSLVDGFDQMHAEQFAEWQKAVCDSPVYCPDRETSDRMMGTIKQAASQGDTLGGIFVVKCWGLPPGLGSYVHWDRRLDGQLGSAVLSIPGIKGVEIGRAFDMAKEFGSSVHDEIFISSRQGLYRQTNRAGGLEGGMTNGQPLVVRAAMKPIPTLSHPLQSVNLETLEAGLAAVERSDVCAVPAASVVGEAAVSYILAQAVLDRFSRDNMEELLRDWQEYWRYVQETLGK